MRPFGPFLALVLTLPGGAQEARAFETRIKDAEMVVERYYRGETLEKARRRVNLQVDDFNARVTGWKARLEKAKAQAGQGSEPLAALETQIATLDRQLALRPDPKDAEALRRFNRQVESRNALVESYNTLAESVRGSADAYESMAQQSKAELQGDRERLQGEQRALEARVKAFEAFQAQGRDVAFFAGLNALLADLRREQRSRPGAVYRSQVERVRALRRALGRWALAQQSAQENGLVLVEALVGDEPCWFIVDTGAQRVCLSTEIIEVAGYGDRLGEESTLVLAGGQKIRGRQIDFPTLTVDGQIERNVAGSAIPASEVGIDGLLGQSFLRRFVYTLDGRRAEPLVLEKR